MISDKLKLIIIIVLRIKKSIYQWRNYFQNNRANVYKFGRIYS